MLTFVNVNNFNTVGGYPNKVKEEIILRFQNPEIRENNKKYSHLKKMF